MFASIFGNDLIKLITYYFKRFRQFLKKRKETIEKVKEETNEEENVRIQIDYSEKLEQDLEQVYFKLVKVNAVNKRKRDNSSFN